MKIGVYFCNCGTNISEKIDAEKVKKDIEGEGIAAYVKSAAFICSEEGKNFLENDLKNERPDRVVIAACSPRDHENTFMRLLSNTGINPYLMQMINIREQIAWVTPDLRAATEKAVRLIRGAAMRVSLQEPLETREIDICTDALVIGAGPAGLKAALSIAETGRKVTLLEKNPFLGGLPVRFEEISPGMECGPCMLEPILGDVLHGPHADRIEVLTLSELVEIKGYYGNFTATIRQSPRHVDTTVCIGCGECISVCPAAANNPYNCNLNVKKAIDFPITGALPNVPFIDHSSCLRQKGGECQLCREACPAGPETIRLDEQENIVERNIGAVIVAVGSDLYDCRKISNLGYGSLRDIFTSFEFERLMASNGPSAGELTTSYGISPKSIGIIHCVGSLDDRHRKYCSGICCQYAFKFNHMIRKKYPNTKIFHLYKEIVVPGKDDVVLYDQAKKDPDTTFVRFTDIKNLAVKDYAMLKKKIITIRNEPGKDIPIAVDMLILCPAVIPSAASDKLAEVLDIGCDTHGFFGELHERMDSAQSTLKGIYLAGACQAPMDIQKAINQGMAAAGYVLSGLVAGRKIRIEPVTAAVQEDRCAGCMVCLSVCPYKAISFYADRDSAQVNPVMCHGCGTCVSACPAGAITGKHFTDKEILAEIEGLLK